MHKIIGLLIAVCYPIFGMALSLCFSIASCYAFPIGPPMLGSGTMDPLELLCGISIFVTSIGISIFWSWRTIVSCCRLSKKNRLGPEGNSTKVRYDVSGKAHFQELFYSLPVLGLITIGYYKLLKLTIVVPEVNSPGYSATILWMLAGMLATVNVLPMVYIKCLEGRNYKGSRDEVISEDLGKMSLIEIINTKIVRLLKQKIEASLLRESARGVYLLLSYFCMLIFFNYGVLSLLYFVLFFHPDAHFSSVAEGSFASTWSGFCFSGTLCWRNWTALQCKQRRRSWWLTSKVHYLNYEKLFIVTYLVYVLPAWYGIYSLLPYGLPCLNKSGIASSQNIPILEAVALYLPLATLMMLPFLAVSLDSIISSLERPLAIS